MFDMDKDELKEYILSRGCHPREKNLQIYERWYANGPRYLFRAADRKYQISSKVICDVGCAYGVNLFYSAPGSYGIEIDEERVRFAKSLGLEVYRRDLMRDDISDLGQVEVVWCSAVIEHVDSPHVFLRKLAKILRNNGLLVLSSSTVPLLPWLKYLPIIGKYVSGCNDGEHVYAFVPSTLQFTCERAGFETVEVSPFFPGALGPFNHVPLANRLIGRCIYVGKRAPR